MNPCIVYSTLLYMPQKLLIIAIAFYTAKDFDLASTIIYAMGIQLTHNVTGLISYVWQLERPSTCIPLFFSEHPAPELATTFFCCMMIMIKMQEFERFYWAGFIFTVDVVCQLAMGAANLVQILMALNVAFYIAVISMIIIEGIQLIKDTKLIKGTSGWSLSSGDLLRIHK